MIEVDQEGTPHHVGDLDERSALALLADTALTQRRVDRGRVRLILRLVEINLRTPSDRAQWARLGAGEETLEPDTDDDWGPEFSAHEEITTALRTTSRGADAWLTDALDIRFRLPRLHTRLEALEADLWKVRHVAQMTHWLPAFVAAHVDAAIADRIDKIGSVGIGKAVALAIATLLPELLEEHDRHGKTGWHVRVQHPQPVDFNGTSFLDASADSLDLDQFQSAVSKIAAELRDAGDDDPLDQRMAKALGVMARRVLAPLGPDGRPTTTGPTPDASADETDAAADETAQPATTKAERSRTPRSGKELQIFIREAPDHDGVPRLFGEVPRWGVVSHTVLDRWLTTHDARFTRIVDLARTDAIDEHDPPAWMRTVVILRDRHCIFPGCARPAEDCDLDHIVAYDPHGPPGQTSPEKLACLCRSHHLLKTHTGWSYYRDRHGNYVWTSPHGQTYIVTTEGTHYLPDQAA